jgi:hypothetical protein
LVIYGFGFVWGRRRKKKKRRRKRKIQFRNLTAIIIILF